MEFDQYQSRSRKTAVYPCRGKNFTYTVLGLVGESGEVADRLKKILRDHRGRISVARKRMLLDELADVLWYLAACAEELGSSLEEVAQASLRKVEGRKRRGTLRGDGDVR